MAETDEGRKAGGSLARSAGMVGLLTLLSRLLGLGREIVFAALFSRDATDAFTTAFTIPNLLRRLLAEGVLSAGFIPVFTGYLERDEEERRRAFSAVLTMFSLVLVLVTTAAMLAAPLLARAFSPGYEGPKVELTAYLTRMVFPHILLVGAASFFIGILHTFKHFTAPALGPVLLNVGIIGGALGLRWVFPEDRIVASMAVGVLVGGVLQLGLQVMVLYRRGVKMGLRWEPSHPAIKEIMRLMAPTLLGVGVYQINVLVSRALSSMLSKGSVTYIYYSDRLTELPLGVVAVAIATVSLPTLAAHAEKDEMPQFKQTLGTALRGVLVLCIPAAVGLFMLRQPLIATLFQRGKFTPADAAACARVFAPASLAIVFIAVLRNLTPAFLALKDTRTPVKIAGAAFVANAVLSLALMFPLGAMGLTTANLLSTVLACGLSLWLLRRRLGALELDRLPGVIWRVLLASLLMGGAVYPFAGWAEAAPDAWTRAGIFVAAVALGGGVFAVAATLLGVEDVKRIGRGIMRRVRR